MNRRLAQSVGRTNIIFTFCTEPAIFDIPGDVLEMISKPTSSTPASLSHDNSDSPDLKTPFFLAVFTFYTTRCIVILENCHK
jgi:hypothetical protein